MNSQIMHIDRIPDSFSDGPFWGNGHMGTVLYLKDGKLHFSIDHIGLWEMRETLLDEPKADFSTILQHKTDFLSGDAMFVEETDIFDYAIGRTKLPALAIEMTIPGKVIGFDCSTNLDKAISILSLELNHSENISGEIYLDSNVNVLSIEMNSKEKEWEPEIEALGWNIESPKLKALKNWGYHTCSQEKKDSGITVIVQRYGDSMAAVLSILATCYKNKNVILVTIDTGNEKEIANMERKQNELLILYSKQREKFYERHIGDWDEYHNESSVEIPDEMLQKSFSEEMYKLYCNEREDSCPVTLQGVWNPDTRMPAWFGDLHNDLNVQACYWPACKTGNVKLMRPYIDWYTKASERFEKRAYKLFKVKDAISCPVMMAPDGTGAASEWCFWNSILGPELFVAVDFTWFYEYSRERDTLRDKIYPFIRKVLNLYYGIAFKKSDGYLHIPFAMSPEVDDGRYMMLRDDPTFTLSSLHYLLKKMAKYSELLNMESSQYVFFDNELAPVIPDDSGFPLFAGIDVFKSHRHFGQLYPVFPLCMEAHNDVADKSLDKAIDLGYLEYAAFSFPYLGIMAARCGRGNMCRMMLNIYCMAFRSRNSFTVNGDPYRNGIIKTCDTNAGESSDAFTLESGFFVPTLICEMFVHRSEDDVWLLPGMPDDWEHASCRNLTIEGGHRMSIVMEKYHILYASLVAGDDDRFTVHWNSHSYLKQLIKNGKNIDLRKNNNEKRSDTDVELMVKKDDEFKLEFEEVIE